MIGLEGLDAVRDDGHHAAPEGITAHVVVDRAQMAEHGIEAFVSDVPKSIDIVGQPREPPGRVGVST